MQTTRRYFLSSSAKVAGSLGLSQLAARAANRAQRKLRVGVMGLGRGMAHVSGFLAVPDVEIAYVCDVDRRRMGSAAKYVDEKQGKSAAQEGDVRKILDDSEVDLLSIAAPNFWHAPATILACAAGKHVYVEKPGSHNPHEALLMVEAAHHHKRKVQMGNQRRSLRSFREGIGRLHEGVIGPLRAARCWYDSARGSIGKGKPAEVPEWLDYDLWQGPCPERPYKDNLIPYQWHWHWHWGNGELGNNGVHALDIARWGLQVDYPLRVTCNGGRYHFDDDQETPDTADATYDFGHCMAGWHGSSCLPRKHESHAFVTFYGDGGSMAFDSSGYRIYDEDGAEKERLEPDFSDVPHFQNLADAIREDAPLNADIADAQKSTMLCHLGNIAYRTRTMVSFDPAKIALKGPSAEVQTVLWKRDYRDGWEPAVA